MKQIYLDHAAATPMREEVVEAMQPYFSDRFYNAGATYLAARQVRQELNQMRAKAGQILGCRPAEIIFTSGASEANNLALKGIKAAQPEGQLLVSAVEHDSVLEPAKELGARIIPVDKNGRILVSELRKLLDESSILISLMLVNNETGSLQPVKEAAALVEQVRRQRLADGNKLPLYLHTDAAQATNYMDLHVSRLGVDLMSINGGKIYGPKGAGLLYVKAGARLNAQILGGGQEFGLRSGTENLAAIAGLVRALEIAQTNRQEESEKISQLRQAFENYITDWGDLVTINGGKHRAPHIASVTFDGQDNETLMMQLDEAGIMCAVGSACSASSDQASHVLKAIGLTDEQARSTLRFSFGALNEMADIATVAQKLKQLIGS